MTKFVRASIALLCIAPLCGCVFDSGGIPAGDGRTLDSGPTADQPRLLEVGPEMGPDAGDLGLDLMREAAPPDAADLGLDLGPDASQDTGPDTTAWDPECRTDASRSHVCRSDAKFGQSGYCSGGKWIRIRYCFKDAPCNTSSGLCSTTSGCSGCPRTGIPCGGTCTSFVTTGSNTQSCCVGTSDNGAGVLGSSCSKHEDCKTGLCNSTGTCFEPCESVPLDTCPGGYSCTSQKLVLGGSTIFGSGCAAAAADAGPDGSPPDVSTAVDLVLLEGAMAE